MISVSVISEVMDEIIIELGFDGEELLIRKLFIFIIELFRVCGISNQPWSMFLSMLCAYK
jgi:hypothetical protein